MNATTLPTRENMVNSLLWEDRSRDLPPIGRADQLMWYTRKLQPGEPDLPSIILVEGKPQQYTDEELTKIYRFSIETMIKFDQYWKQRKGLGAHLLIFRKTADGRWRAKEMEWEVGVNPFNTLEEAIQFMERIRDKRYPD